jgi:phage terminase large subunit-like protein
MKICVQHTNYSLMRGMGMGLAELSDAISEIAEYRRTHRMEFYVPYDFQKAFHHARAGQVYPSGEYKVGEGNPSEDRALICANQIGKTMSAAMETAFHATGEYPDWWDGVRFSHEVDILCIGKSNDSVMKVIQNELMGDPLQQPESHGTGTIPKDRLIKTYRKPGVVNALSSVTVRHNSGKASKIWFLAYEQDIGTMMGIRFDIAWPDEEPPQAVMSQLKRGQLSKDKKAIYCTFTPEEGITEVVDQYLNNMEDYQAVIRARWEDAGHFTPEKIEAELKKFPPHERDMRSKGIPMMGSGLIFPVMDEDLMVEPFELPPHWYRIGAIDFGYDHPFGAIWMAHDRDTDTVYVYDCYRESKSTIGTNAFLAATASAVKHRGTWIPVAWPHDGLKEDSKSGIPLADQYRAEGLTNLLQYKFSNPPGPGQKEGQGGNGVEVGLFAMLNAMEEGRFKVFSTLWQWFEEKRQYHRTMKDGKVRIVALREDLMSATRYAYMSLRFARTRPMPKKHKPTIRGATNW